MIQSSPKKNIAKDSSHPFGDGALREKVYEGIHASLYQYRSDSPKVKIPVCIVFALVNKPYILDLSPQKSFLRSLLSQGISLYLIEWNDPARDLSCPSLEEYIQGELHSILRWIQQKHSSSPHLMGICQGGTFCLMYTALHPENVKTLTTIVTPVDFHAADNLFSHWVKFMDIDKIMENWRYVPGFLLNIGFLQLKPFELLVGKYVNAMENLTTEEQKDMFLRMEKWIFDSPSQASAAWGKFVKECYQNNNLIQRKLKLGDSVIDLKKIVCPVLNIIAENDHLVPRASSEILKNAISSPDYTFLTFPTGHIGIFVGGVSQKKIAPAIGNWLCQREV